MLSETACKANAFGMTYLGEKARMTKYRIAQMKQYLELILGIQSIVSLAVLALQRFMMVTRDRQVAFLCRYIGCAEKHVQVVVVTKGLVCACVLCLDLCASFLNTNLANIMVLQFPLSTGFSTLLTLAFIWIYR